MSQLIIRTSRPTPAAEHINPARMLGSLVRNRGLIVSFTARDVFERHKGALLGWAWNIIQPLLSLAIYTVVFGYIFGTRWEKGDLPPHVNFPVTLFAGLAVYQVFSESMHRAPVAVSSRPNFVRKVVFPIEILPVTVVATALVHMVISIALLLVIILVSTGELSPTVVYFPLVVLPLLMLSLGLSWALAAIGIFIRDVRQVVIVLTQLLMFTTPLFFQIDRIPPEYPQIRWIIEHNPLSVIVESSRRVLVWNESPNWLHLGAVGLLGLVTMMLGYAVFSACRRSMADVH